MIFDIVKGVRMKKKQRKLNQANVQPETLPKRPSSFSINGAALKWIAVLSMLIDHTKDTLFEAWLIPANLVAGSLPMAARKYLLYLYNFLYGAGRLAFPIFCFLLAEGFSHTRDRKKYLLRLLLFGFISELPSDFAILRGFTWERQNVFFTLFLGLLGLCGIDRFRKNIPACLGVAVAVMALAELFRTDYGWTGIAVILLFGLLRDREILRDLGVGLCILRVGLIEAVSWLDFILFHFYGGERGRQYKYFFYAFYPVHLSVIWLIRYIVL